MTEDVILKEFELAMKKCDSYNVANQEDERRTKEKIEAMKVTMSFVAKCIGEEFRKWSSNFSYLFINGPFNLSDMTIPYYYFNVNNVKLNYFTRSYYPAKIQMTSTYENELVLSVTSDIPRNRIFCKRTDEDLEFIKIDSSCKLKVIQDGKYRRYDDLAEWNSSYFLKPITIYQVAESLLLDAVFQMGEKFRAAEDRIIKKWDMEKDDRRHN